MSGDRSMNRVELKNLIVDSFADAEVPPVDQIAEAKAWDSKDVSSTFEKYLATEPPVDVVEYNCDSLPTFRPVALRYFIRYFLLRAIEAPDSQTAEYLVHFLANADSSRSFWVDRLQMFNPIQKQAVCEFLKAMKADENFEVIADEVAHAMNVWCVS